MARRRPQDAPTVIFHQRVANQPCAGCGNVIPLGQQKTWTRIKGQTANYDMECAQRLGILIYRDGQWYRPGYQKPVVPKPANEPFHPRGNYVPLDGNFHPAPTPPAPPVVADEDVEFEGVEDDEPEAPVAPAPVPPPPAPVEKPKAPAVIPDWLKGMADALLPYVQDMIDARIDKAEILDLIQKHAVKREVIEIVDRAANEVRVREGHLHPMYKSLVQQLGMGINTMLIGPVASGKTTAGLMAAKDLGFTPYLQGPVSAKHEYLGYEDGPGKYHATAFHQWFVSKTPALLIWDEYDGNESNAILDANPALENGICNFPYCVELTEKGNARSVAIASANTWGLGATDDFVGRLRQDAAALDRWSQLFWDYDLELERMIAKNDKWVTRVQTLRENARKKGLQVVISPRASYRGAKKLAAGWTQTLVEQTEVRKAMSDTDWRSIQ